MSDCVLRAILKTNKIMNRQSSELWQYHIQSGVSVPVRAQEDNGSSHSSACDSLC
jgi:hypothetical protein